MYPHRGPPPNPHPHPPAPAPPFPQPQPFVPIGTPNTAHNPAGTHDQRYIGSTQGSAYPPDYSTRNAPNLIQPPNIPPRHPSTHFPAYPPMQDSVPTHPAFPMPQVQDRVPPASSVPPPPMMQRPDTTHFPSHHNNTHVTPGHYTSYPPQAPYMSHSPSQRGSGISEAAHFTPIVQRNQDGSGYGVQQSPPPGNGSDRLPKGPPSRPSSGVHKCPGCGKLCPETQAYCTKCAGQRYK